MDKQAILLHYIYSFFSYFQKINKSSSILLAMSANTGWIYTTSVLTSTFKSAPYLLSAFTLASPLLTLETTRTRRHDLTTNPEKNNKPAPDDKSEQHNDRE